MNWTLVLNTIIYSAIGLGLFCISFVIIDKVTPYHLWDQLIKEKNVALAIVIGCVSLGLSLIIAAAVHG